MSRQVEAVYEQGVLRPLEPLSLLEHQQVRLTIEEKSAAPVNERLEEMRWFAEQSGAYPGEWVAIEGPRLVAHGHKLADVRAAAKSMGAENPLFARVPSDATPFGGW